jgi:hypothetical protein
VVLEKQVLVFVAVRPGLQQLLVLPPQLECKWKEVGGVYDTVVLNKFLGSQFQMVFHHTLCQSV